MSTGCAYREASGKPGVAARTALVCVGATVGGGGSVTAAAIAGLSVSVAAAARDGDGTATVVAGSAVTGSLPDSEKFNIITKKAISKMLAPITRCPALRRAPPLPDCWPVSSSQRNCAGPNATTLLAPSLVWEFMRRPSTKVPARLPKSCTQTPPSNTAICACWRETRGSGMISWQCGARPTSSVPGAMR